MMKNTLLSLSIMLMAITTLVACDSKEVVALAVETETTAKTIPVKVGACTIDSIKYDRDANQVAISVVIFPLTPEPAAKISMTKEDAGQEMDLLLRTSELTRMLVAMVNAEATLSVAVRYGDGSAIDLSYTPQQLKAHYDAPQLTAHEYASQSMALNLAILTKACPLPFWNNTMTMEKASATDSVITYELNAPATVTERTKWTFANISAGKTAFQKDLSDYITNGYNGYDPGWQSLIKDAWKLERTLCFKVKDPASGRTLTFDFPARASLYWIINPR